MVAYVNDERSECIKGWLELPSIDRQCLTRWSDLSCEGLLHVASAESSIAPPLQPMAEDPRHDGQQPPSTIPGLVCRWGSKINVAGRPSSTRERPR